MRDTIGSAETGAWGGGVNLAIDATMLPANASPHGLNSALALARTGTPFTQKRKGVSCLTPVPCTGSEAIIGQHDYVEVSTGTRRHLCTTATSIYVKDSAGAFTLLSAALTSGNLPSFATANNLAFLFNGVDAKKVRGTTVENVGIVRPTVGSLSGAVGAAGLHNGTYELRVAFKNLNTGHISSSSDTAAATVVATNDAIDWSNIPVSADTQVGARLLLVRNIATQAQFYVAGTVSDNVTTTATTSVLDENLVVVAPTTTNRNPPPSGIKYCVVYRGRLVLSDGEFIYWSPIDEPEAFHPFRLDGIDSSGDQITGLLVSQDMLIIAKDDRTFTIRGDLGGLYQITQVDANVGCSAHKTMVNAADGAYWWSRRGIVRFRGGALERIGLSLFGDPDVRVNANTVSDVACAVVHDARDTIYFALPDIGQDRNTFILPFNAALGVLESERWDPMDAASLGMAADGSSILQPTLGNHTGQVFQVWSGNNDGVRAGTSTGGTFTADSASITGATITSALALDITANNLGGLIGRKVTILDADGEPVTSTLRPRITACDSTTVVSWTPAVAVTSGAAYTLIIGGPNYEFDTPWRNFGNEWVKKRFEYLFTLTKGGEYGSEVTAVMSFDHNESNLNGKDHTVTIPAVGAGFDIAVFDVDVFDASTNDEKRHRIARTGRNWRVRVRNAHADQPVAILSLAVQAVGQTVKR